MSIRIRQETPADVAAIEAATVGAFLDATHTSHTEQFIVDALRRSGQLSVSLVAEDEGAVIGHVAVSPVTVSDGAHAWYGLGPISVLPGEPALVLPEYFQAIAFTGSLPSGEVSYHESFAATGPP